MRTTTLVPLTEEWSWQMRARCRGEDPDIFFSADRERGRATVLRQNRAKALCGQCTVARECREYALKHREPFGVWGGLSEDERVQMVSNVR